MLNLICPIVLCNLSSSPNQTVLLFLQKQLFAVVRAVSFLVIPVCDGEDTRTWNTQKKFVTNLATLVGYLVHTNGTVPNRTKTLTPDETHSICTILGDLQLNEKPTVHGKHPGKYSYPVPKEYVGHCLGVGRFLENQARKYKIGRYKVARKGENGLFEPYYQALYMCDLIKMAH